MVLHRFQEQLRETQPAFAAADSSFVACPVSMFPVAQQAQILEVYRIAAELTREQLKPKRSFALAFSRN